MANEIQGIDYETALANLRASSLELRGNLPEKNELLNQFYPDYQANACVKPPIGSNMSDYCHLDSAKLSISHPLTDDYDLSGAEHLNTDVLVIGDGGVGVAAALSATEAGVCVIMANKLRIGDSSTVMAKGGIQVAVGVEDSLQQHSDDIIKSGYSADKKELVVQMVTDAPSTIRWLIGLGMTFDLTKGADSNGMSSRKRAGGATVPRILSYRDFTGLEMMRVLHEVAEFDENITQLNRHPAIELLSDEHGRCIGVILYDLEKRSLVLVHAKAVILVTGGSGRLHLQGFAAFNHYSAAVNGLAMVYRTDAKLRNIDPFQYHPTGVTYPLHLAGVLIFEAVRSVDIKLVSSLGEHSVNELQPCNVAVAATLHECRKGRGVVRDGQVGVFLDTPRLIENDPDMSNHLVMPGHVARKCGIDPAVEPVMIHPTLHYQNGGVEISGDGATCVEGLYCAGEVIGNIHGRNRLIGNALLDIISFGRRTGKVATGCGLPLKKARGGVGYVHDLQREMTRVGLTSDIKAPVLYPDYGKFDLREHAGLQERQL